MDSITFDNYVEKIVGAENVLKIPTDCAPYEQGWRYGLGKAFRVIRPGTVDEISQLLSFCNEHGIAVVPQGGNTGLVGASVPDTSADQIVLSLSRLNKQVQIDIEKCEVTVSAGVVLDALNEMLEIHHLWLPIDIGSSGSCQIGGIVATNAAGTRAGRYGNVRQRLLSMKVILADGSLKEIDGRKTVSSSQTALLQDNSALDRYNPFCGSSGWLGVVVEATFSVEKLPTGQVAALLLPSKQANMDELVNHIKQDAGKSLSALEGMADTALRMVAHHVPDVPYLFASENLEEDENRYALLVELSSTEENNETLQVQIETLLMHYMEKGWLETARADKPALFWKARHAISEALKQYGEVIACDIALPFGHLAKFRKVMNQKLKEQWPFVKIVPFGHEMLAACHYNIVWPKEIAKRLTNATKENIKKEVYTTLVNEFKGTYSAEHGIGPYNQHFYDHFTPNTQKTLAKELKLRYDPNRIMNPNIHFD